MANTALTRDRFQYNTIGDIAHLFSCTPHVHLDTHFIMHSDLANVRKDVLQYLRLALAYLYTFKRQLEVICMRPLVRAYSLTHYTVLLAIAPMHE